LPLFAFIITIPDLPGYFILALTIIVTFITLVSVNTLVEVVHEKAIRKRAGYHGRRFRHEGQADSSSH
jgi:hypothetical protein